MSAASSPAVKVIGSNGQISLGKQFAGRQVLIEEPEPGVWLVRTATVILTTNVGCTKAKLPPICNVPWHVRPAIPLRTMTLRPN